MGKYFASVQFVVEADSEEMAERVQEVARASLADIGGVVYATADEPVEFDEYGHAG